MHEILNSFKQKNPSQNFKKNSSILKNTKNFQKLQNLGFKTWNTWKWEKKTYQVKGKTWKAWKALGRKTGVQEEGGKHSL